MREVYLERKSLWPSVIAIHLLLPTFWQIAGLNITYLYPIILLCLLVLVNKLKIKVIHGYQLGAGIYWMYLLWISMNTVNSKGLLYAIVTAISTVGLTYLIVSEINTRDRLNQFIDAILYITFIACILGIVEAITGVNIFQTVASAEWSFFTDYRMGIKRIMVQFAQPIVYGLYLILVSPLAVYRMARSEARNVVQRTRIIYILMCINIVLTVSRAPMFAFLLLQLILWYMVGKSKFLLKLFAGLIVGFIALEFFSSLRGSTLYQSFQEFLNLFLAIFGNVESNDVYSGVADRFELFEWVQNVVGNDIWFGKGLGAIFEYKVHEWQIKTSIENEYLNTFFHLGIVGVVFELCAFLGNVIYAFKSRCFKDFDLAVAIGFTLLTYYIVIVTCGESSAISTHITLIAILTAYNTINRFDKKCNTR